MADVRADVLAEVRSILSTELEHEGPFEPSHRLASDLGVDSMGAIVLAVGLEDRFQVRLAEEDTAGVETVRDLVEVVARRIAEKATPPDRGPGDGADGR